MHLPDLPLAGGARKTIRNQRRWRFWIGLGLSLTAVVVAGGAFWWVQRAGMRAALMRADPDSIVSEFRTRFVEPKIFWDTYHHGQFANYLFNRHTDGPYARYTNDTVHKLVEEANLFIDAAHKAHAKYRQGLVI